MGLTVGELVAYLDLDNRRFDQKLDRSEAKFRATGDRFGSIGGKIGKVAMGAAAGGVALLGAGLVAGAVAGLKFNSSIQQTTIAMGTMLGSAAKARTLIGEVTKMAASTPFEFPELADATKRLVAYGVSAKDAVPLMKRLGDISSALAIPLGEVADLYGKMKVSGRITMEDINQMAGRGIPIYAALADVLGVGQDKIRGLVETGKVGFPDVEKAVVSLTDKGSMFGGMMDKQSRSFAGVLSTLKDSANALFGKIMKPAFEWLTKEGIPKAITLVDKFSKGFSKGGLEGGLRALLPKDVVDKVIDALQSAKDVALGFLKVVKQVGSVFISLPSPVRKALLAVLLLVGATKALGLGGAAHVAVSAMLSLWGLVRDAIKKATAAQVIYNSTAGKSGLSPAAQRGAGLMNKGAGLAGGTITTGALAGALAAALGGLTLAVSVVAITGVAAHVLQGGSNVGVGANTPGTPTSGPGSVQAGLGRYGTVRVPDLINYKPIEQKILLKWETMNYGHYMKVLADVKLLQALAAKGIVIDFKNLSKKAPEALNTLRSTLMTSLGITQKKATELLNEIAGKKLNFKIEKQTGAELKKTVATVNSQGGVIAARLLAAGKKAGDNLASGLNKGQGPTRAAAANLRDAAAGPVAGLAGLFAKAALNAVDSLVSNLNDGIGPALNAALALANASKPPAVGPVRNRLSASTTPGIPQWIVDLNLRKPDTAALLQGYYDWMGQQTEKYHGLVDSLRAVQAQIVDLTKTIMGTVDLWPSYVDTVDELGNQVRALKLPTVEMMNPADISAVMDANLTNMRAWVANMDKLRASGLPKELLDELTAMGLGGAGQVAGLAAMTADQLAKWTGGWLELQALAGSQAQATFQDAAQAAAEALNTFAYALQTALEQTFKFLNIKTTKPPAVNIPSLAGGGTVSGPTSGYLALMHGTETVTVGGAAPAGDSIAFYFGDIISNDPAAVEAAVQRGTTQAILMYAEARRANRRSTGR